MSELGRIAIIGDGLASAITLNQLVNVHKLHDLIRVDIFSLNQDLGRGLAYSKSTPETMLLNHRVKSMRFSDTSGAGFLNYLQKHFNPNSTLDDYVPRKVFGDYVSDSIHSIVDMYPNISVVNNHASRITPKSDGMEILTESLKEHYDDVVICMGTGKEPQGLALDYAQQVRDFADKNIAIIGASLSALDLVSHFYDARNKGFEPDKITLLQREPGFRMVRTLREEYVSPKILTPSFINQASNFRAQELINLVQQEIESHGLSYDLLEYGGLIKSDDFSHHLKRTMKSLSHDPYNFIGHPEYKVSSIMLAIIPQIMDVFEQEKIAPDEAEKFRKRAEKAILAYLAPMPSQTAGKISELIEQNKLDILNGCDADKNKELLGKFDAVLDARGINSITYDQNDLPPLVQDLMTGHGAAYFSNLGGVAYDPENSRMRSMRNDIRMPYVVGQLKKGQQFDCSESEVIYRDCVKICDDIARKYTQQSGFVAQPCVG